MKLKGKWKRARCSAVYERCDGLRIHTQGLIRTRQGGVLCVDSRVLEKFVKIVGGRRHRALMAYANEFWPMEKDI